MLKSRLPSAGPSSADEPTITSFSDTAVVSCPLGTIQDRAAVLASS